MLASLACTALLLPQGPGEQDASSLFQLPSTAGALAFPLFEDASGPLPVSVRRAGCVDFSGSGNADAWFLADEAPFQGVLTVKMARTSHVGRYREWLEAPGTWTDAASFRHATMNRGEVLLADPAGQDLTWGRVRLAPGGDPRLSTQWESGPSGLFPGLPGIFEVATAGPTNSWTHDTVAVLADDGAQQTLLRIARLDANRMPTIVGTGTLPLPAKDLRICDYNGDGRTDLLMRSPGLGLVVCADDGSGHLDIAMVFPDAAGVLGPAFVGQVMEEKDSIGATVPGGIVIATHEAGTMWDYRFLPNPSGAGAIAEGHIIRRGDGVDVYGIGVDGTQLVLHRFLAAEGRFQAGALVLPGNATTSAWVGPGAVGRRTFASDVDRDGDLDLLWQLPDRKRWLSLPNRDVDLRLRDIDIEYRGLLPIGFKQFDYTVPLPESWNPAVHGDRIEVHNFIRNNSTAREEYWAELEPVIDPVARTATFTVFFTEDPFLTMSLHASPAASTAYQFGPGTLALGGKVVLSIHLLRGTKRSQTWYLDHDPDYDGNKSPGGVKWVMRAAPPLPKADDELLPW